MTPTRETQFSVMLLKSLLPIGVLVMLGVAIRLLPTSPEFTPFRQGTCTPGASNFVSSQPPALPGEWKGSRGYFVIPGSVELNYCQPGHLIIEARGDLATNGGAPLLVMRTDAGQREKLVDKPQTFKLDVGLSGRVILAFPNDETDALYRIVTLERLVVVGRTRCTSALVRDQQRITFQGATTGAVYDLKGQRLEPCEAGDLYLTVSGPAVNGIGPQFLVQQEGAILLNQEIKGRASFRLPLRTASAVQLSVTNFAGRQVKYRNLFIDRVDFTPLAQ